MKNTYFPNLKKMPLSSLFYALSDPVRIEIVLMLLEEDERSCGECARGSLSKSTMSHHFKVLTQAGFLERRKDGKFHTISLREEELEDRAPGILTLLKRAKGPR